MQDACSRAGRSAECFLKKIENGGGNIHTRLTHAQMKNFNKINVNIDVLSLLIHFLVLIEDKVTYERWLRRKIAQKCLEICTVTYFCIRPNKEREPHNFLFCFVFSNF